MATRRSNFWPITTVLVALFAGIIALPQEKRQWLPGILSSPTVHLGLDLAGGSQLDFRISEREIEEQEKTIAAELAALEANGGSQDEINGKRAQQLALQDQKRNIVEAIRTVLERRINALGVSEAVITPSYVGDEKHLLVECPGVVDTQDCIDTVGKTIKLEFKEEHTEQTEEYEATVREKVATVRTQMAASGETLAVVGEDLSDDLGLFYQDERQVFESDLTGGLEALWTLSPSDGLQQIEGVVSVPQQVEGTVTFQDIPGIFLAEVTQEKEVADRTVSNPVEAMQILSTQIENTSFTEHTDVEIDTLAPERVAMLRSMQSNSFEAETTEDGVSILYLENLQLGDEQMEASHILVAYQGAVSASPDITRSKEEALAKATELKATLEGGADFAATASQESDGPSGAQGGSLGSFGRGKMVPAFEEAAFSLADGEISDITETQFGYHIIRADKAAIKAQDLVTYNELQVGGEDAEANISLYLEQIQKGLVTQEEQATHIRTIFFSFIPTGWKDTALDGKHFRSATVTLDTVTNLPIVQIIFDDKGATLFQELTKENIGKRIAIFVGGQLVSAPTVQSEIIGGTAVITGAGNVEEARGLAMDLNTGAIPAPIFLTGQRTVEATLGAEALRTSLSAALIGILILMLFMIFVYRFLGILANIALAFYALLFFAILKLPLFLFSSQHIVLTLAGMAGIILSIGMAVDANVLIFERIKEELRKGKHMTTAAETGFARAWPSIRDGNVSTFITCSVLFMIGTSIIRGFAVTLGMGVLISMFSAIVITRWLVRKAAKSRLGDSPALFGVKQNNE